MRHCKTTLRCRLFGHKWRAYQINAQHTGDYHTAFDSYCKRCTAWAVRVAW